MMKKRICSVAIGTLMLAGSVVPASAQPPNPNLVWINNAITNWIIAIDKNTGRLARELQRPGMGNGTGIAVVGNIVYYTLKDRVVGGTVVSNKNVYKLDKRTGAELGIAFSIPESVELSAITYDGRNFWVRDYDISETQTTPPSRKAYYVTPGGVVLKTITLANCGFQCDTLEYVNGNLISDRNLEGTPSFFDRYDTDGNLLQAAFLTTTTHPGRSLAWDGTSYYVSNFNAVYVYSTAGALLRTLQPGGSSGGPAPQFINYRDLSFEYPRFQPSRSDFDGDGRTDLAVYRPSQGGWYVRYSSQGYAVGSAGYAQWGLPGDIAKAADSSGDSIADLAVFRPQNGTWYVGGVGEFQWGLNGDIPVTGDFDGDARSDLAVFRPANGGWYLRRSSQAYSVATASFYQWGLPGDVPLSADFDSDGTTDLTVFRPGSGEWFMRLSSPPTPSSAAFTTTAQYQWGLPGDTPLAGDFDGDGATDLTVWRPSTGEWYIRYSSQNFDIATSSVFQWGLNGDEPLIGDFDGDGRAELTVYRPSTGEWYIRPSAGNYATSVSYQWGLSGDVPVTR